MSSDRKDGRANATKIPPSHLEALAEVQEHALENIWPTWIAKLP